MEIVISMGVVMVPVKQTVRCVVFVWILLASGINQVNIDGVLGSLGKGEYEVSLMV